MSRHNTDRWVAALTWQAVSPVHPGTGQVSASDIDLPVAREGGTGLPYVPGSTIKGVFRDGVGIDPTADAQDGRVKQARLLYGHTEARPTGRTGEANGAAGDLTFTDARLFAVAMPSFWGTFALVTCPLVLNRLSRDRQLLGLSSLGTPPTPARSRRGRLAAFCSEDSVITSAELVVLNDLDFEVRPNSFVAGLDLAWPENRKRLLIVHDDVFSFLCRTSLEVSAHVRLKPETKTVVPGALWFEETIPAESLFSSFVLGSSADGRAVVSQRKLIRLGGKSSVGRGLVRVRSVFAEGAARA